MNKTINELRVLLESIKQTYKVDINSIIEDNIKEHLREMINNREKGV